MVTVMVSCPYCGNTFSITSCTDGNYYCPTCHYYFKMITSTIADIATIPIPSNGLNLTDAANADRGFYYVDKNYANISQPKGNSITINAKSITINNDKISITIDKDNIDKFDIIEINGVKFVKEND